MSETGKGNRRFFAVTSFGKKRWYWVVWPSLSEVQRSDKPLFHVAEGVEETKADAVENALEAAGRFGAWIAAKYAKAYYRNTKVDPTRMGDRLHRESQDIPVLHEFLYRDIYDAFTKQWVSTPHRIVRRTNRYIYVEQDPYSPQDLTGSWLDDDRPTYRLDRGALEQNGYAFIPATASLTDHEEPLFFISRRGAEYIGQWPTCLDVLQLKWPCTVAEVQESYRRLVKAAHPDGGGSHDKFLELQAAYEQAMRLCR